jgi:hypothetical protein
MTRGVKGSEQDCYIEGCTRTATNKGLCSKHRHRLERHGSPYVTIREKNVGKRCLATGCKKQAFCRNYCQQHYGSVFRHGRDYLILAPRGTGYVTKDGYREFTINGEKVLEHVMLAERALGRKLPEGAVVHHMNEDKLDNFTPLNLVICPDQAYHMFLHKRMRDRKPSITDRPLEELGL